MFNDSHYFMTPDDPKESEDAIIDRQWIKEQAPKTLLDYRAVVQMVMEADGPFISALQEWAIDAKDSKPQPKLYRELLRLAEERLEFQVRKL